MVSDPKRECNLLAVFNYSSSLYYGGRGMFNREFIACLWGRSILSLTWWVDEGMGGGGVNTRGSRGRERCLKGVEHRSQKTSECTIYLLAFKVFSAGRNIISTRITMQHSLSLFSHFQPTSLRLWLSQTCTVFLIAVSNTVSNSAILHA